MCIRDRVNVGFDSNGNTPLGMDSMSFSRASGSNVFLGKVKQLQVFKTALTDSELIALTTI